MFLSSRGLSTRGLVRELNEDSGFISPRIVAVADGMGGHAAGEIASRIAINVVAQVAAQIDNNEFDVESEEDLIMSLPQLIDEAISAELEANPEYEGMGTTLSLLFLNKRNEINVLHIGDSRIYQLQEKERKIKQLTVDHTVAQELFEQGRLSADEIPLHPGHSFLTQVLRGAFEYTPMLESYEVQAGDRFLLASDGLTNVLNDNEIYETLVNKDEAALTTLVKQVEKHGAPDNVTIIEALVVNVDEVGELVVRLGSAAISSIEALDENSAGSDETVEDSEPASKKLKKDKKVKSDSQSSEVSDGEVKSANVDLKPAKKISTSNSKKKSSESKE